MLMVMLSVQHKANYVEMERQRTRDSREPFRREENTRGSDKRSYERRPSRSRSRDRKRDRNNRRTSRSRSNDRKRDRGEKDDDRSRKSHRSDNDRDHGGKKANHPSKTSDSNKIPNYEVVEDYDDSSLKEIEDFITDDNVDEVEEEERLAAERKLRRDQILQKYNAEKTVSAPTSVHLAQNTSQKSTYIIEQNIAAITDGQTILNPQESTSSSLAALVIAERKSNNDHPIEVENSIGLPGIPAQISSEGLATVTIDATADDSHEIAHDSAKITRRVGDDAEPLNSSITVSSIVENTLPEELHESKYQLNTQDSSNLNQLNEPDSSGMTAAHAKFLAEVEERQAEKNALRMDAHSHKESQPFDMFSSSPSDVERGGKVGARAWAGRTAMREALLEGEDPHLQSNWDDGDGYYKPRIGELIGDQYQTMGIVGKGVFSIVIKCIDLKVKDREPVAIKVIRNNDTMRKAAEKERSILSMIKDRDPENRRHCVRLLSHFEFRNHVALVFDYQQMNLRETLKKFGKDVGINIGAVRMYARQLLVALRHLADLKIVHADIKLDNILCSGDLKQVKLCDFGSAFRETDTDNDPTPYLVSRFYRAPEIILGLPYDRAIDLWSVAVCLYELFTGHVMFPGRTNNEMLRLMMAVKGRFANKQLKNHFRAYEVMQLDAHFEERDLKFKQMELDPVTGKSVQRLVDITQPSKDLASVIRSSKAGSDDGRLVSSLSDLLDKCLALDPQKRIFVSDALKHPFFTLH